MNAITNNVIGLTISREDTINQCRTYFNPPATFTDMKATTVYFFPTGVTACCDERGQQIPELQESWFMMWLDLMIKKGFNPDDLREINLPSGRVRLIKYTDDDGKTKYNWQS